MYKVKLSPEEALETIKLRMKYDSSKTLTENVGIVKEQKSEEETIANQIWNGAYNGGMGGTNEKKILDAIIKIKDASQFDSVDAFLKKMSGFDITQTINDELGGDDAGTVQSIAAHLNTIGLTANSDVTSKTVGKAGTPQNNFNGNFSISKPAAPIASGYDPLIVQKNINNTYCSNLENGKIKFGAHAGETWEQWMTNYKVTPEQLEKAKKSCKKKTSNADGGGGGGSSKSSIPAELKDVKDFQDWLDKNHPGWHDKYNTLNKDTSKGYGKFGPRTTKAWATYKDKYLKGGNTPTGNPDLEVDDKEASLDQPF